MIASFELRKNFLTMNENSTAFQAHHDDHQSVLEQLTVIKTERAKSNRILLERRRSSKRMGGEVGSGGGEGGGKVVTKDETLKPRPLKEKGVPTLSVINSYSGSSNQSGGERSLFS